MAYLHSVDLWLIVSGAVMHPAAAGEAQTNWDNANNWVIGLLQLTIKDHVLHKVDTSVKKNLSYFHLFLSYPQNKRNKM